MVRNNSEKTAHIRSYIKNIAFFGDANIPESDPDYKHAYGLARLLAQEGYTIVDGGGPGVMHAATSGAHEGGGETISVTFSPQNAPGFEGKYVGNIPTREIKTSNYIERMFKLIEHADAFVIFKGGSGTISEFGTAWVLAKIYYGHHKPFILFGKHWIPIIDALKTNMNIDKQEMSVFEIVEKVDEVLPVIRRFEKRISSCDHSKDCKVCVDRAFMS